MIIPWAGLSARVARTLKEAPHVAVHNIHHNAEPVAESALALLLSAAKRTIPFDSELRKGSWLPRFTARNEAVTLGGKTALVLGYGAIGRRVAQMCKGLGMRTRATRRTAVEGDIHEGIELYRHDALHRLLPESNVLIVCLPLTGKTKGLIGAEELSLLPKDALLVNVARAKIVDEQALFDALQSGHLFGAGLDVWYRYPRSEAERGSTYPGTCPFHELNNVVLSPHRADHCKENEILRVEALAQSLNAAARGEEVPNALSLEEGY